MAPAFLDLAGAAANIPIDGRSIMPLVASKSAPDYDTLLTQAGPRTFEELAYGWLFRDVRTARYTYVYYPKNRFTELYDRKVDPAQLNNVADDPAYAAVVSVLTERAVTLGSCSGPSCRATFGAVPEPRLPR